MRRNITYCEARFEGCWVGEGLSFAHPKKSRHLTEEEKNKVILACMSNCHKILDERMDEDEMELMIDIIIQSSDWPTRTEDLNMI
jgi:hypothetical protein